MRSRRALGAAFLFLAAVASPELARAEGHPVQVVVPDGHTLQYVSFWAALGGQRFAREGVTVEIAVPPRPADAAV